MNSKHFESGAVPNQPMDVSSTGNVSDTFEVVDYISIPSDRIINNVIIAELDLDAKMSWVCVPKKDTNVYLNVSLFIYLLVCMVLTYFVGEH